jgi:hypothetical protein
MAETRASNPLVDQFRRGGVPKDLRLMAAQGALPLKPTDLVELLHFLLSDREEAIQQAALASLRGFPAEEMLPILKDRDTPADVLAWGLSGRSERELREVVLQNTSTTDDAIEGAAAALPMELAELVVINQTRLLRSTSLLVALESNAALNNDQKRRLRELRETFHIGAEFAEAPPPPPKPAVVQAPPPVVEEPEPVETPEAPISEGEAVARYLSEEERQEESKVSAVQRLYRLNTAGKVIAALKGNREERAVLVRDPNRIVSTAVLGSPRLTEAEIESFAAMKNVSDEILRQIGNNRDWTKKYSVISNLVRNPRTPLAISLGMVVRLNPKDLKTISVDRNVPEVIRKQAQRFVRSSQPGGDKEKK